VIITQTPLRVSFAGGGTDFPDFYRQDGGCVLSSAIDKYVYVIIKKRFDDLIRVGYTKTEMVESVDEIEHELVREAMRLTGVTHGVEISTMADIPSQGSGLGSSSSVTVGLLNALYAYRGEQVTADALAQQACRIEIDILAKPIGKQDQYIAAGGSVRFIQFHADDTVTMERAPCTEERKRRLNDSLLLFYTGRTRRSETVLGEQKDNIERNRQVLRQMKGLAVELRECVTNGIVEGVGEALHRGWLMKKELATRISDREIDDVYDTARKAGALGGKLCGAGGGGFFLFSAPNGHQDSVRGALHGLRELPFNLEPDGSKVILNVRRE
jgi:D-glycero-alpha-D-manno-heptose-7-phosphate kinase